MPAKALELVADNHGLRQKLARNIATWGMTNGAMLALAAPASPTTDHQTSCSSTSDATTVPAEHKGLHLK